MIPVAVIWSLLALGVLGLALYRKLVSMHEDDYIHLDEGEGRLIPQQVAIANKLDVVDRWGKTLTVITIVSGLGIAAVYLYGLWLESFKPLG